MKYIFLTAIVFTGLAQAADQFDASAQKLRKQQEVIFHQTLEKGILKNLAEQWNDLADKYKLPVNELPVRIMVEKDQELVVYTHNLENNKVIVRMIDKSDKIIEHAYEKGPLSDVLPLLNQKQILLAAVGAGAAAGSLITLAAKNKCTIL